MAAIKDNLQDAMIVRFRFDARKVALADRAEIGFRALLRLLPFGVGSALDQLYWGTKDKRWRKKVDETKVDETMEYLSQRMQVTEDDLEKLKDYYQSDEFATLFEATWMRIRTAAQERKLAALRGALLSVLTAEPNIAQDQKELGAAILKPHGDEPSGGLGRSVG